MIPVVVVPGLFGSGLRIEEDASHHEFDKKILWPPGAGILPQLTGAVLADGIDADDFANAMELFLNDLCPVDGIKDAEGVRIITDAQHVRNTFEAFPPTKLPHEFWKLGYKEGENCAYIPYDWRLPPSVLHDRFNLWENMAKTIEELDKGTGVALLAMSLGNLAVLYFVNFAEKTYGREWLDKHVHSLVQCGAPNLGSPQAVRGITDAVFDLPIPITPVLLTMRRMARSIGGGLWMAPRGVSAQEPIFYLRRGGALLLKDVQAEVNDLTACGFESEDSATCIEFKVDWGEANSSRVESGEVSTCFGQIQDGNLVFEDDADDDVVQFGGPETLPEEATLKAYVTESLSSGQWGRDLFLHIGRFAKNIAKKVKNSWQGRNCEGFHRAKTDPSNIASWFESEADDDGFVTVELPLRDERGKVTFKAKFLNFEGVCSEWLDGQSLSSGEADAGVPVKHTQCEEVVYDGADMKQMLKLERLENHLKWWQTYYEDDELFDQTGESDCPPVKRILAFAAVEVPTAAAFAMRIGNKNVSNPLETRFELDQDAVLSGASEDWTMSNGVINKPGDFVLPASSTCHVEAWSDKVDVTLIKLEASSPGSRHGTELKDKRCWEALKELLTVSADADTDA
mmetsp:Transcript_47459/g.91745  ORF Transcript_47459/g.91745 Transcript_47459/m.91745 type:complete len:626 (-) Transcript_47459:181-2058(-)